MSIAWSLSLSFVHADMKNLKNYSNYRRSRLEKEWRIVCYSRDAIVHLLVDLCSCRDRASQRLFWIAWFDLAEVIHFLLHLVNTGASRQMLLQMLRHCCCTRWSTKSLTFESCWQITEKKNKNFYHHSRSATIPAGGGTRETGNSSLREEERDNFVQFGAANTISTLAPRIVWNCTHGSLMQISSSKSNNRYGGDHSGLDEIMWEQGLIISAWRRLLLVQASTPTRCPSFGWCGAAWWQAVFPCRRMTTPVRKKELAELILHLIWWCCNTTEILPRSILHLMLQYNKNLPSASAAATQDDPSKILFHLMLRHNKILLHLILAATQTRSFFFFIIIIIWCCNTNKILSAFDLISC